MTVAFTCDLTIIVVQFHQEEVRRKEQKRFRAIMKDKAKQLAEEAKNQTVDKEKEKVDGDGDKEEKEKEEKKEDEDDKVDLSVGSRQV